MMRMILHNTKHNLDRSKVYFRVKKVWKKVMNQSLQLN